MKNHQLLDNIRQHEKACSSSPEASFGIKSAHLIADGVIVTHETDGEFAVYYDKEACSMKPDSPFDDQGENIRCMPAKTGFFSDVTARTLDEMAGRVRLSLEKKRGGEIKWFRRPVDMKYSADAA